MISRLRLLALAVALSLAPAARSADDPAFPALEQQLRDQVRPILDRYCHGCHNEEKLQGDLDLARFDSVAAARRHTAAWEKSLDQVALGEMPPDDEPQPTAEEKNLLMKWIREFLEAEGRASAGDPGRVVMRRLNNTEYTLTVRDLTGVPLDPAREFPVDGAAGEGFVNVGEALAMSPALFDKYLAAAKEIASHAVLLPDGFRFSASDRRGDWADEVMAEIRALYARHTEAAGGTAINLQGIEMDTNTGGRLPVARYLTAMAAERDTPAANRLSPEAAARAHGLNPKYFARLRNALAAPPSSLLASVADHARTHPPAETATEVGRWQAALTRFQTVGHVKPWMVPIEPLQARQEVRVTIPAAADHLTLHLSATDAGDGRHGDVTVWEQPRLVMPGRPDVPLRDVRALAATLTARRDQLFARSASFLAAAAEAAATETAPDVTALAARHGVPADGLAAWLDCLGISRTPAPALTYLAPTLPPSPQYSFVNGWGSPETPSIIANASEETVRVPANLRGHSVALHPSPTLSAAAGWSSPLHGRIHLHATVTHAHPECGNGVTWSLQLRRGHTRRQLAAGIAHGATPVAIGPIENLPVRPGDLLSIIIGPRDGNHACDTTDVEINIREITGDTREWSLAHDVSPDILAGNPHADSFGQPDIWHFYTEPVAAAEAGSLIPPGSALARWQAATTTEEQQALAQSVQDLLTGTHSPAPDSPDATLRPWLGSLRGPLLSRLPLDTTDTTEATDALAGASWGLDPSSFATDGSLRLDGPSHLKIPLPPDLVAGCEFAASVVLTDPEGSVQVAASLEPPAATSGLRPDAPILVTDSGPARQRFLDAFADFRDLFPAALCYPKIIPVDEVITLTVYHREDDHLARLMLDDTEKAALDRLWEELRYIGEDALTMVDAYAQLLEYASQDSDPKLFYHLKEPIDQRAAAFRQTLAASEPRHLAQLVDFAALAYRRPTTQAERDDLRALYHTLRQQDMAHEEAFRLTLARVLVAPAFLYRAEEPAAGEDPRPVNDWELASRLSYFLWSTAPDARLRTLAAAGTLSRPAILRAEARRLLDHSRARALATEFACQWLHLRDFDQLDEKSERHFPEFKELRDDMYEESILFFTDLFRNDQPVMSIVDADHTFLNDALASHYGIPGVTGPEWRRVDGMKRHGRGGVLGMATVLAKHSGASRTSPILRGNWLVEVLLGDKLPKPPQGVPPLPEAEDEGELTMRQITERHSTDPRCFGCHARIDAYGYALESFDAIGRLREFDLGGRPLDTRVTLPNGLVIDGAAGLRTHLSTGRREEFLRSFCRKLLGYALGRGLKLSDNPLVDEMMQALHGHGYRFTAALDRILESPQFLRQRGLEATREEEIR